MLEILTAVAPTAFKLLQLGFDAAMGKKVDPAAVKAALLEGQAALGDALSKLDVDHAQTVKETDADLAK